MSTESVKQLISTHFIESVFVFLFKRTNDIESRYFIVTCKDISKPYVVKNLLTDNTHITFYRNRHQEFLHFFFEEKDLVYCIYIVHFLQDCNIMNPEIGECLWTAARDC